MSLPDPTPDVWPALIRAGHDALAALAPAVLGSAVGQAWKTGLSWRQRLTQWLVGILVSYYVTLAATEWMGWGPFVAQAVGFVIAMMAFEVAPKVVAGVAAAATAIPQHLADLVARFTR